MLPIRIGWDPGMTGVQPYFDKSSAYFSHSSVNTSPFLKIVLTRVFVGAYSISLSYIMTGERISAKDVGTKL